MGLGLRVKGLGLRAQGLRFRTLGFRVYGLESNWDGEWRGNGEILVPFQMSHMPDLAHTYPVTELNFKA